jgi:hypothetical protein
MKDQVRPAPAGRIRAFAYAATWAALMVFLWAPWNGMSWDHGHTWERLYGFLGYYVVHHSRGAPVSRWVDADMLACSAVLTLAYSVGLANGYFGWSRRRGTTPAPAQFR